MMDRFIYHIIIILVQIAFIVLPFTVFEYIMAFVVMVLMLLGLVTNIDGVLLIEW